VQLQVVQVKRRVGRVNRISVTTHPEFIVVVPVTMASTVMLAVLFVVLNEFQVIVALREMQERFPGQQVMYPMDGYEKALTPGADLHAVYQRVSMQYFLRMNDSEKKISGIHQEELGDAVFKVFATFPIQRIKTGQKGYPFDADKLAEQIENEMNPA
jgi:hypothetical protein